jgi:hypothetical protein
VGFANSGGLVFVDESAEEITAAWASSRFERRWIATVWRHEAQSAVRSVLVVGLAVDAEHVLEMASAEDQGPVEAVVANRANPAQRAADEFANPRGSTQQRTT